MMHKLLFFLFIFLMHKLLEIIFSLPCSVAAFFKNGKCNMFFSLKNDEFIINSLS